MALTSDTSQGGTVFGQLLQTNEQRLVDRMQGGVLTDINRVIDEAGKSVSISLGATNAYDTGAASQVQNSSIGQNHLMGYAAIAAVVILALFVFLRH